MLIKSFIIWIFIAVGEIINGNIRVRYLQQKFGKNRAKKISFFSGIAIFTTIIWFSLSWIGPSNLYQSFGIGLFLMLLMILLDIYFGKYIFRYSWKKIAEDFNPNKGNLLGVGMLILLICPAIIFLLQRQF
jgi:hypothetical protein